MANQFSSVQSLSQVRLFATPWIAMNGLSVHHHLPEFTQTHVHRVCDAIQSSHPRSSPSPPAPNPSQHQSLFLCCWKRIFSMTSAFSWRNSISICPASFCTPRPNLPVTPGVSWLPTFAFQSPIMKRTIFLVLAVKGLVVLHRTVQFQLLQHYQ